MKIRMVIRVSAVLVCAVSLSAQAATKVTLVGLFPGKAVVVIDGGAPRTISVGQKTPEKVTLIQSDKASAIVEIDGKKQTLQIGEHFASSSASSAAAGVVLAGDERGHFFANGQINGKSLRFLVDTGASMVSISAPFATSAGIDYTKGQLGVVNTANGQAPVYRVKLNTVKIGDITLHNVDGLVHQGAGLDVALLGMSFLNRMEMKRDGAQMVLTKRY